MKGHRVWAEINLSNIAKNLKIVKNTLNPYTKVLAVVKANGYGHGAVAISHHALKHGAYMLGVGDSQEALELRESGITGRILILGAIIEEEIPKVIEHDIRVTVHSKELLPILNSYARKQDKILKIHVKVDTGMTRLGTPPRNVLRLVSNILTYPNLQIEGICTHLSSVASGNIEYSKKQITIFNQVLSQLSTLKLEPFIIHAANSAATFAVKESHYDMIRTGIAMYGIDPGIFFTNGVQLEPVLTLKSRIAFIKQVQPGTAVSYDQRHIATSSTLVATCPVGYNDGYPFTLTNKGEVLVRGKKARVVGNVTMDYIMIDVGHIQNVKTGDEVTLIGRDGLEEITVSDIAKLAQTVPYEITCRLGSRVRRIYTRETKPANVLVKADLHS